MWVTQIFSFALLVLGTCHALPTKNLENALHSGVLTIETRDNIIDDKNSEARHPIVQSKPRILVSYGNVYKQAPVDPVQNLLMYFLMNAARDFGQDQEQFERRRSSGFFDDVKSKFSDVAGKVVNGSKKVGEKIKESYKSISSREIPIESQYEESRYFPHLDGTCMCFNRLIRRGPIELKSEDLRRNANNDDSKDNTEPSTTEKRIKEVTDIHQLKNDKTTELKIEDNMPIGAKEKSTVSVENPREAKENDTVVRVLNVFDLDNLDMSKISTDSTTTTQKQAMVEV